MYMRQKMNVKKLIALIAALAMLLALTACGQNAAQSGSGGIKLQLLHVLEGTDLAEDYRAGKFTVMTLEEYVALVSACVRRLPEDMVVHRMTGDGPKRILLAPLWSGDKKRVLNALNRALAQERRDSDVLSLSAGQ